MRCVGPTGARVAAPSSPGSRGASSGPWTGPSPGLGEIRGAFGVMGGCSSSTGLLRRRCVLPRGYTSRGRIAAIFAHAGRRLLAGALFLAQKLCHVGVAAAHAGGQLALALALLALVEPALEILEGARRGQGAALGRFVHRDLEEERLRLGREPRREQLEVATV